jgi:peptidoglycan/LPS O-acetylase OafA/YrhL
VVNICESIIGAPDTHPAMAIRLIGLALTIAVTIVLAALSYRLFEVRFHKRIGT